MKDWREELQRKEKPAATKPKDPSLCRCMAGMKGKWISGKYTCIRCGKPVYDADAFGKKISPGSPEALVIKMAHPVTHHYKTMRGTGGVYCN